MASLAAAPALAQVPCAPTIANETLTPPVPGVVNAINFYDDLSGTGPQFFAGGNISSLGNVARLTPTGWQQVGDGLGGNVNSLEVIDDSTGPGGGPALYAGGDFGLSRWSGTTWDPFLPSPGAIYTLSRYDDGAGPALFVLTATGSLRKFTGGAWQNITESAGLLPGGSTDRVFTLDDDGAGPRLPSLFFCASSYTVPGLGNGNSTSGYIRFDGTSLQGLPGNPFNIWIKSAAVFDDGIIGPALYASGHPSLSTPTTGVTRWSPATNSWVNLGQTSFGGDAAYALTVFADGVTSHPRLYAIGSYATVSVIPSSYIAAWNGQTWTRIWNRPLGSAQSMNYHFPSRVGTLGAAHIPALLYAGQGSTSSTTLFAITGCPRCPGDVDLDGHTTTADLLLYLDAWFAGQPSADIGGNGQSTQDILDFLTQWFTPCP
jgi:hypothetical protein